MLALMTRILWFIFVSIQKDWNYKITSIYTHDRYIHSSSIIIFVEGHQRFEIPQGRIKDFLMIAKFFLMDTFSGMLYRQRWSFWGFELTPPLLIFWLIAKFFLMDIFSGPETTMIIANLGVGGCYWDPKRKIKNWPLNFTQLTAKGYSRHSFLDGFSSDLLEARFQALETLSLCECVDTFITTQSTPSLSTIHCALFWNKRVQNSYLVISGFDVFSSLRGCQRAISSDCRTNLISRRDFCIIEMILGPQNWQDSFQAGIFMSGLKYQKKLKKCPNICTFLVKELGFCEIVCRVLQILMKY